MKKPPVLHPFLFALFIILALYAHSTKMIPLTFNEIAIPLGLILSGSAMIYFFLKTLIKHPRTAGILVSLFLIWFFAFEHIKKHLRISISNELFLIINLVLLASIFIVAIRSKKDHIALTRYLNIVAALLVVYNLAGASRLLLHTININTSHPAARSSSSARLPNVFFILLDAYGRADVLSEIYEFDNSEFVKDLEQKGFYVAAQSPAGYCYTDLSLASALNLTYLDELAARVGPQSSNRRPLFQMIRSNQVRRLLKDQGYSFVSFSSGYYGTEIPSADFHVHFTGASTEFRNFLITSTPLAIFFSKLLNSSQFDIHRNRILGAFQALSSFSCPKSPCFIFAHIFSPHPPFVFGKNGENINPGEFSIDDGSDITGFDKTKLQQYIMSYRDQLSFINKKIIETVDSVLEKSEVPPIIILQSDHGPRAFLSVKDADASYLRESMAVLNAIYLPGGDYHEFYQGISPVNTFIALINRITGTSKPFLKDKSSYSTWEHPYDFVPFDASTYSKTLSSFRDAEKQER